MPTKPKRPKRPKPAAPARARPRRSAKTPKTYRLDASTIAAAQEILGAATATEAIETALDMVVFRRELVDGTRAMLGAELQSLRG
jgi:DNA-binding helix-hairpin-helix protein with protein kinase domain